MQRPGAIIPGEHYLPEGALAVTDGNGFAHYRKITFRENRARRRALREFKGLVTLYFDESSLNLMTGNHRETEDAGKAREAILGMMNSVYSVIRRAGINPRGASSASFAARGHDRNIDLILNIFNLGRNGIPHQAAIDYIEQAVDVYKADRLPALFRTVSPFYWAGRLFRLMRGKKSPAPDG